MRKFLWILVLTGCSSVNEISNSNHVIQSHALEIMHTPSITVAHTHASAILKETNDIAGVIGNVKDSTPWWAELLSYGFISMAVLGVCFLLWYTGIGSLIKKLCYSLGMFIPDKKLQQAKLLQEAKDASDPTTIREAIAAIRAADPAFDAAYKKLQSQTP